MIDFTVAKRTQLRQKGELDRLFGVSYPMTNAYLKGKSYPRGKNRVHIAVTLDVLAELLKSGKLPLSEEKGIEARAKAVTKIHDFVKARKH